jgi:hypothetical protein
MLQAVVPRRGATGGYAPLGEVSEKQVVGRMVRQCDPLWRGRGVPDVRQILSHCAGHNGTIERSLPDSEGVQGFRRRMV